MPLIFWFPLILWAGMYTVLLARGEEKQPDEPEQFVRLSS
jgi:hypothetical protein